MTMLVRLLMLIGCLMCTAAALNLVAVYEYNDPGSCRSCSSAVPSTGGCLCPNSASLFQQAPLRVLDECAGLHGAHFGLCVNSDASQSFGGSYQQDDPTPNSLGCRSMNPLTSACSCPGGYSPQSFRVVVDTNVPNDFIGSTIVMCVNTTESSGGMFMEDSTSGQCLTANPNSGSCTCRTGFTAGPPSPVVYPNAAGAFLKASFFFCASAHVTEICPGVSASLDGVTDVTAQVMACIRQTPSNGVLNLPPGRYGIASQVLISSPIVLGTRGLSQDVRVCAQDGTVGCATFVALPVCCTDGGVLNIAADNVIMDHIIIDGNRDARSGTASWSECLTNQDNRGNAVNARVSGGVNVTFRYSASVNALCASAFQWQGDRCHIGPAYFAHNGNHADGRWADGLTLLSCQNGHVHDSTFVDNTDVNLVCGCGAGFLIENIVIRQQAAASFAGFMFDNFDNSQCGNYVGGLARNISINCASFLCDFGANFGPHAWYPSSNIVGGKVTGVAVSGAKQGVNCAGAGTAAQPLTLDSFVIGPVNSKNNFNCGVHATSTFNVAPGSFVTSSGCPTPTNFHWNSCP